MLKSQTPLQISIQKFENIRNRQSKNFSNIVEILSPSYRTEYQSILLSIKIQTKAGEDKVTANGTTPSFLVGATRLPLVFG